MNKPLMIVIALLMAAAGAACQPDTTGEKVEDTMEEAGDDMQSVAEDVGNEVEDACEEVKEGAGAKDTDC